SEKWFIPYTTSSGQWNSTTVRGVKTADGTSPAEGVLLAYGPAYGNSSYGMVMYEAGHDLTSAGTVAEQVSAQRAFFNYVLYCGRNKKLTLSMTTPSGATSGKSYAVSASASGGVASYTYQWNSTIGSTFTNAASANTTYNARTVANDTTDVLKLTV